MISSMQKKFSTFLSRKIYIDYTAKELNKNCVKSKFIAKDDNLIKY